MTGPTNLGAELCAILLLVVGAYILRPVLWLDVVVTPFFPETILKTYHITSGKICMMRVA